MGKMNPLLFRSWLEDWQDAGLEEAGYLTRQQLSGGEPTLHWEEWKQQADTCTRCSHSETRQQVVFGEGPRPARLVVLGAAPTGVDDAAGRPFQGPVGDLLDKMLQAMGTSRADVGMIYSVKCRGPEGEDIGQTAAEACRRFLSAQLKMFSPELILVLGPAAWNLLGLPLAFERARGQAHVWETWQVLPTFHPAALIRTAALKREAWADLQRVMTFLSKSVPSENAP